ncbi:hypothetical protein, partial [Thalassotalea marina]|uniref:hypothetical protein n=1 Tax=Thalassotalea marina TaxID=1673741 RepID=UPI001E351464
AYQCCLWPLPQARMRILRISVLMSTLFLKNFILFFQVWLIVLSGIYLTKLIKTASWLVPEKWMRILGIFISPSTPFFN